jgi:hypothetical protein
MTSEEFKNQVQYKSIISETNTIDIKNDPLEVHSLFDNETNRLLAASRWTYTISILNEAKENTYSRHSLNKIYDLKSCNFEVTSTKCFLVRFYNGKFEKDEDNFTFDELYTFHLNIEKAAVLDYLNFRINLHRRSVLNGSFLQESIYNFKQQEAEEIQKNSEVVDDTNYPFLREYAELKNIDLKTAAKEVLIQIKIYKTRLNNTETMRLKYKNLIKDCSDITKINYIFSQFLRESTMYARI